MIVVDLRVGHRPIHWPSTSISNNHHALAVNLCFDRPLLWSINLEELLGDPVYSFKPHDYWEQLATDRTRQASPSNSKKSCRKFWNDVSEEVGIASHNSSFLRLSPRSINKDNQKIPRYAISLLYTHFYLFCKFLTWASEDLHWN